MENRRSTDSIILGMNREIGEIGVMIREIYEKNGTTEKTLETHDGRLTTLEDNQNRIKWFAGGIAATISGAAWVMGLFK